MKRVLMLVTALVLTLSSQGCAIYATPYGYSAGYYGYAPYWGFGYNYWPHSYYSYRPHHYHGFSPGYPGWGGRPWGGGSNWGGHWGGGGRWGGGHGGWHGR